ncbi:MAG: TSUP family transporter [Dongiaceae bacterium]
MPARNSIDEISARDLPPPFESVVSAVLLWRGYALHRMPGRVAAIATGGATGLLNGAFGIAGPPVILFYFSSPAGAAVGRASIIAFFLGTDALGLVFLAQQNLITIESFWRFLLFLPALLLGVWLGARGFMQADPKRFRQWTLILLMALAALTGIQGVATLLGD